MDSEIAYDERGLVACIVQDWASGEVLTLAYMNALALERTVVADVGQASVAAHGRTHRPATAKANPSRH